MPDELIPADLTDEQKGRILGVLSVGCDRQTAAQIVGSSPAAIRRAMQQDAGFAVSVCRTEGTAEFRHMSTVQKAAEEAKNWRAAVWWLERRSPERFGPRGAGVVTATQLRAYVEILIEAMQQEVRDDADRRRMEARLRRLLFSVQQMERDLQMKYDEALSTSDLLGDESDDATRDAATAEAWDDWENAT